jgi:hypothetical protein
MQNEIEMMVNYDGLSNKLSIKFFQELYYYQQNLSPFKIPLRNYYIYF